MDILNYLISLPVGLYGDFTDAFGTWLGSCFAGACDVFPNTLVDEFANTFSSVGSLLSSGGALIWTGILALLPDGGAFPQVFHDSAQYFGNSIATVNFIVPVSVLIYCMSIAFSVKLTLWTLHIARVIVSFVRGVSVDSFKGF